ncbi:hypothetical protein [Engelhardtia mirabilis]|uniref:Uncharacterized protein n=1 Tax=Engelhardtia mirabilis TaxID=2528011 RepID=A0A518BGF7_9BACT|nr:hypothetical protein Pla133_11350 [Planctomycetes bacterium Pla133]QDV00396.1 hypothetical protein Pla86_11350 [Planctomycetes bacterium Pla86]
MRRPDEVADRRDSSIAGPQLGATASVAPIETFGDYLAAEYPQLDPTAVMDRIWLTQPLPELQPWEEVREELEADLLRGATGRALATDDQLVAMALTNSTNGDIRRALLRLADGRVPDRWDLQGPELMRRAMRTSVSVARTQKQIEHARLAALTAKVREGRYEQEKYVLTDSGAPRRSGRSLESKSAVRGGWAARADLYDSDVPDLAGLEARRNEAIAAWVDALFD